MWKEFRDFIARGNVMDLAIGVIIGAAFGKIVTTLVEGILMPPLGLILGRVDFSSLFHVLDASKGVPASIADAKTRGIPVIAYGQLPNESDHGDPARHGAGNRRGNARGGGQEDRKSTRLNASH